VDPSQSLSHLHRKLQTDGANRQTSSHSFPGLTVLPPPAYTPTPLSTRQPDITHPDPYANDESDGDGSYYPPPPPITIKVDAPLKDIGHANIVGFENQTMTARLASTVVASIQRSIATVGDTANARPLEVTVGCGVTIVGSRNAIGDGMTRALMAKTAALKTEMEKYSGSQRNAAVESRKRRAESVSTIAPRPIDRSGALITMDIV
jgi:ribosomal protein S9